MLTVIYATIENRMIPPTLELVEKRRIPPIVGAQILRLSARKKRDKKELLLKNLNTKNRRLPNVPVTLFGGRRKQKRGKK